MWAAGLDTTKEDYWYKYHQQHLKALVKQSAGFLKRDYAAEKIGGTKGRPYKPVRVPKERLTYKKDVGTKSDLKAFLNEHLTELKTKEKGTDKSYWTGYLSQMGAKQEYRITKTPKILESYGIKQENVVLRKTDLAYILYRHASEYPDFTYDHISEVIDNYDVALLGRDKTGRDFKFYKVFESENESKYGLEVAINKDDAESDEFIVHLNYIGKRKADKTYEKLKKKETTIDSKK